MDMFRIIAKFIEVMPISSRVFVDIDRAIGDRLLDQSDREITDPVMNVIYDSKTDTLSIELAPGAVGAKRRRKPGVILDYDAKGNLLGLEILVPRGASPNLTSVNLRVAL